jgi:hypothetical protein
MVHRSIPVRRKLLFAGIVIVAVVGLTEGASRLGLRYTALGPRINAKPLFTVQETFDLPPRPPAQLRLVDDLWIRPPEPPNWGHGTLATELPAGPLAVLVGGSSPHGAGMDYNETFWATLGQDHVGGLTYVNASIIGYRVDGAVAQLRWALELGDVRVAAIYAGDNEWGGWMYPRVQQPQTVHKIDDLFMTSAAYRIAATSLRYGLAMAPPEEVEHLSLAEPMNLDDICLDVPYGSFEYFTVDQVRALRQRLLDNFRDWLHLGVTTAAEMDGTTALLLTNPIRYRLSPCHHIPQIVSEAHAGSHTEARVVRLLRRGYGALLEGNIETAMPILIEAWELDPESSLTNHYLAWACEAEGDIDGARRHFRVARNRTVGGAGMIGDVNDIIRQVAAEHPETVLVDLEDAFNVYADRNGLGLGDRLFFDWCHPSAEGVQLIIDVLRPVIESVTEVEG